MKLRLLQVLISLGLLLALETAARIVYTVQLSFASDATWFTYTQDTGWERRPWFRGLDDCDKEQEFGPNGFLPEDLKRLESHPARFRALFLGDSNTYGYCLERDEKFTEVVNRLLPDISTINLGVPGYSSYQGLRTLQKYGDRFKPDIVFISFNYNDRRLVLDQMLMDSPAAFERMYTAIRIRQLADHVYIFRAARFVANWLFPPSPATLGKMPQGRLDTFKPRVDAENYRQNLVSMLEWAQSRGIATAFILFGDNPDQTFLLREGLKLLNAGKNEEAIAKLNAASNEREDYTFWQLARVYLAKAYKAANKPEEALEALTMKHIMSGAHGGYPIVLDTDYHRIMRDVGERYKVPIIEAAAELEKTPEVYIDQCHFDSKGHETVARLAVKAIESARVRR